MDFGDAPASYGTWLEDDGARHTVDAALYLGSQVDAENCALSPSLSRTCGPLAATMT